MNREETQARIDWLLDELAPLSYHSDINVGPHAYDPKTDTIYMNANVRLPGKWAKIAYEFGNHDGMKYDRGFRFYGIDGQPRVSSDGLVWVRYVGDFLDGSKVGMNVWSQQPSHFDAEVQLGKFYGLFSERNGLEPFEVFKKYL